MSGIYLTFTGPAVFFKVWDRPKEVAKMTKNPALLKLLNAPYFGDLKLDSKLIEELDKFACSPANSVEDRAAAIRHGSNVIGLAPSHLYAEWTDEQVVKNYENEPDEHMGGYH